MNFLQFNTAQMDALKNADVVASLYDYPKHRKFFDTEVASVSLFVSAANSLDELEATFAAPQILHYFFPMSLWTALSPLRKRLIKAGWVSVTGGPKGHIVFAKA